MNNKNIVCIDGGTGAAITMLACREISENVSGIIATSDEGRSTGKIREIFGLPALGDLRQCLSRLSDKNNIMSELMEHRLRAPSNDLIDGMATGNLVFAGLVQMLGGIVPAIEELRKILQIREFVLPATEDSCRLNAELTDGRIIEGEVNIRALNKAPIKRIFFKGDVRTNSQAEKAIRESDYIIVGPGSLYTSLMAVLMISGINKAIAESSAELIFVCNLTLQPGQTDNLSALDHVLAISSAIPAGKLSMVIFNKCQKDIFNKQYLKKGIELSSCSEEEKILLKDKKVTFFEDDLLDYQNVDLQLWDKQNCFLHDVKSLGKVLANAIN